MQSPIPVIKRENNGSVRFNTLHVDHNDKKQTYKFLWGRELKQFHKTKVITGGKRETAGWEIGAVDVCFVSVTRPNTDDLITKNTEMSTDKNKERILLKWLSNCAKFTAGITYLVHEAHVILLISFLSFKGFPLGTVNTKRS